MGPQFATHLMNIHEGLAIRKSQIADLLHLAPGAVSAAGNPEHKDGIASPRGLPGQKGVRQPDRAPENADKEEDERQQGEKAQKKPEFGREEERQKRPPGRRQDTSEGEDMAGTLTAVQEARPEDSSHASGEAWHSQVRP
ncbi:hypothetical protein NDU88_008775 [Pleurodeles waltl]|uniref:Uncharacterized protein n=1 Tax=Pleurodeles waltl TaxID=8319 RepID=A0AAV7PQ43_PLEWA|nr:hypothetical protein NDU88_008775 [Pleurodeles waltl]